MHISRLWTVVIYSQWLYIVLEHSRSLCNLNLNLNYLIVHTKWLVNMQMMSLYCGLLIVWTLIDRLHRDIAGFMYLLDVLVVVVHISHRNCWEYLLLHQDWGEWEGGGRKFLVTDIFFSQKHLPGVLKRKNKNKLGGRRKSFFFPTKIFFQKCSWGSETHAIFFFGGGDFGVFGAPHAPTRGSRGVGKRYTSFYDHDMWPVKILERSGLAVKSYHPETLAAEE